jgi:replicative DNA helicase
VRAAARRKGEIKVVDLGGRVPRHSLEAEATLIASMLSSPRRADEVLATGLAAEHFYCDANRRIYEMAVDLRRRGQPIDVVTVCDALKEHDWLQAVGGVAYVARIIDSTPAVANIEAWAQIVRDCATVRAVTDTCQLAAAEGLGAESLTGPVREWVDSVEARLHAISAVRFVTSMEQVYEISLRTFAAIGSGAAASVPSGIDELDRKTGGWREGQVIIVAGRPGMGKTAFGLNCAVHAAKQPLRYGTEEHGESVVLSPSLSVVVFSLEMPKEQLVQRMWCSEGRIPSDAVFRNSYTEEMWSRLVSAADGVASLPIWIDDSAAVSVVEMRSKLRAIQREQLRRDEAGRVTRKLGLVVIDYVQLVRSEGDTREEQVAASSRDIKAMARELGVPVLLLAQVNRAVEMRAGKARKPQMSDLRESGSLEQDADVILFPFRPEYYLTDKLSAEAQRYKGYAEIIVAKQRNGPTGIARSTYEEAYMLFGNRDADAWAPNDHDHD